MNKNTTLLLLGGGIAALYLYSKSQANAMTPQQQLQAQQAAQAAQSNTAIDTAAINAAQSVFQSGMPFWTGGQYSGAHGGYSTGRSSGGGSTSGTYGYGTPGGGYMLTNIPGNPVYVAPGQAMSSY